MTEQATITALIPLVEFPCEEWTATRTHEGELVSVEPIPGTWTLVGGEDRRRLAIRGLNIKAFFACPRCRNIGIISEGFNPPKELGDTRPLPELHCRKCQFGCRIIFKDWDKRQLYCACYETIDGGTHKEYLHAENEQEAKRFFWAQHGPEVAHIAGIAPVIGFFLQDEKTDQVLIV
jgi:hypothetical protein